MTKPRPGNMFEHPQASAQAPMRDKLLFVEAMTASGELTLYELRVAAMLALSYSTTNGCAIAPMQYIADALGIPKQHVGRTIRSLEAKGWFLVEHGTRGGGKNRNPNRYRPNVSKVPSAVPFYSAALRRAQHEQGTSDPQSKVPEGAAHGTCRGTESGYYVNPVQNLNPADLRSAPLGARGADFFSSDAVARRLGFIEAHLRKGHPQSLPPDARARWARETYAELNEIDEAHDGYTGDPIGGWAQRLSNEVYQYLDGADAFDADTGIDVEPDREPEPAFQRETDRDEDGAPSSWPPPGLCSIDFDDRPVSQQQAEDDEQPPAKRPWRKPSYVEVDLSRWPRGRKFGPWLGQTRNRLRVQVRDLADAVGLTASDLFDVEIGHTEVARATQRKYVAALYALVAGHPPALKPAQQNGAAGLEPLQASYGGEPTTLVRIVAFIRGEGGTVERFDITHRLGLSAGHAQASLKTLVERGWLERVAHGRYRLTEAARAAS